MTVDVHRLWEPIGDFSLAPGDDRRWLEAKLNFLALAHPGAEVVLRVASRDAPVATVRSLVAGEERGGSIDVIVDHPAFGGPMPVTGVIRTANRFARRALGLVLYDELRQRANERQLARAERSFRRAEPTGDVRSATAQHSDIAVVGLYWLELGGAEKWAISTLPVLRAAGLTPIVVIDRRAPQRMLAAPELEGCVVVSAEDEPESARRAVVEMLFGRIGARLVTIHHSDYLYDFLPLIRQLVGDAPIIDTTHVVEWETGGYPLRSAAAAEFIDVHHVVSRSLGAYLERFGVDPASIVVAPLTDLGFAGPHRRRTVDGVRTIGFVGRLARQKRPWLFLELVARLRRRRGGARAIVHGDGPLAAETRALARSLGLDDALTFRTPATPVDTTYDEIDALVISSQNEGLTLIAMEAIARGVIVVSADVGAQRELVAAEALLPSTPIAFLRRGRALLRRLRTDASLRGAILEEQRRRAAELSALESAKTWFTGLVNAWGVESGR